MTSSTELLPHDHAVSFYDEDADVVGDVAHFLAAGLAAGERLVVVATAAHGAAIEAELLRLGHDAALLRSGGRYLALDAGMALASFMMGGVPHADRFAEGVGSIVDAALVDGTGLRVFGEMVALLWDDGNVASAVQLEGLWNDLAESRQFTLMCAYPASALENGTLADATEVCNLHSSVSPPQSYAAAGTAGADSLRNTVRTSETYLPVPSAVPATRRFVSAVLRSWKMDELIDDAQLIASEIATNAVKHAVSAFRVRLQLGPAGVRIAIQDIGLGHPERRHAAVDSFMGRGVAIVEMTADSWGCESVGEGKEVWAELTRLAL
jgi:anti-sigma regulatory factor (Ser/Thr protein kinase)